MSWNRDLQFWFAFKSVSFITGPSTSTAQSVDKRDIVYVTDPVHSIAAQALADLGYQPQPQRKLNQRAEPEEKKFVKAAMEVMQDLPSDELPVSKCELTQKVTKSGNRTFFVHVNKEKNNLF